ncbi:MAG: hypothetical protein CVV05_01380 [Gammaproteobacteria bacterium HGW-Gammaproteobacteria-1]|jgi:hypothetical protein|nr:MAG: hypothetical protein CVV05_01380 [Gammaproteobacteria bacterium HGW-Gammaproteobacteria-1]
MRSVLLVAAVLSGMCSVLILGIGPSGPFAAWSAVVGWAAMACSAVTGGAALLWPWFRHTFVLKDHTPELCTSARKKFG